VSTTGSVSRWIRGLEAGDAAALQSLWERYFVRLVALARGKLPVVKRLHEDEEDVALSAFNSFFSAARRGKFPRLIDRDDLWQILVMLTHRKAVNLLNRENRDKAGGKLVRWSLDDFSWLIHQRPDPAFAAELTEEYRKLLDRLDDPLLRDIAIWKMEGHTNAEIADRLGLAVVSVERKLRRIRAIWQSETVK
jgi:DNA-directed RNA polymerase specialized sigma24 family protein